MDPESSAIQIEKTDPCFFYVEVKMTSRSKRLLQFIILSLFLLTFLCAPLIADVAYIIKRPSGDRNVSIIFSYDPEAEAEILAKINEDGHILQWQIQCADKYVFYRPFEFTQGGSVSDQSCAWSRSSIVRPTVTRRGLSTRGTFF